MRRADGASVAVRGTSALVSAMTPRAISNAIWFSLLMTWPSLASKPPVSLCTSQGRATPSASSPA